jgi:hypothetical protein
MRFLGLGLADPAPNAKTVWLYREQLAKSGVIEELVETFAGYLKDQRSGLGRSGGNLSLLRSVRRLAEPDQRDLLSTQPHFE